MNQLKKVCAVVALILLIGAAETKKTTKERVGTVLDEIGSLQAQAIEHGNEAVLHLASINKRLIYSMNELVHSTGFFTAHDKSHLQACRNQLRKIHEQVAQVAQSMALLQQELSISSWCAVK